MAPAVLPQFAANFTGLACDSLAFAEGYRELMSWLIAHLGGGTG